LAVTCNVGGLFTTAGGVTANNVAHWDGSAWASLGTDAENGVNGTVTALASVGQALYVGGVFTQAGSQASSNIALWQSDVIFSDGFETR
jgi:trimeric autotransporter adhesin